MGQEPLERGGSSCWAGEPERQGDRGLDPPAWPPLRLELSRTGLLGGRCRYHGTDLLDAGMF